MFPGIRTRLRPDAPPRPVRAILEQGLICAVLLALAACGGGEVDKPSASPTSERPQAQATIAPGPTLSSYLYSHTTGVALYHPPASEQSQPHLAGLIRGGGLHFDGGEHRLVEISYASNNLPQLAWHVSAGANKRLLVYNHGHGGLPLAEERWAHDFFKRSFAAGYDLLITSMPGTGLNLADPARNYWTQTWGSDRQAAIDPRIFPGWTHAFYEIIRDQDHYLHYFIDHMVALPAVMDARPGAALNAPRFLASASGFPAPK